MLREEFIEASARRIEPDELARQSWLIGVNS